MKLAFADTSFFVAQMDPRDKHHAAAVSAARGLGKFKLVTSEMVLTELLNLFSERGPLFRENVAQLVETLRESANVEIVPQTSFLFRSASALYKNRLDKGWSLTDCASFEIMSERKITDALTHDHHFEQAGFRALMRNPE